MHTKVKRAKKASVDECQSQEALQEPQNIAVKLLTYKEIKEDFQNSLIEHYTANRKIFPTFSVLNPTLLNTIRISKRSKYIWILNKKLQNKKRTFERQLKSFQK